MLVDADGLAFVCAVCGLIGFALGWCGGAVDAIQRRREFDAQQRTSGVPGTEAPRLAVADLDVEVLRSFSDRMAASYEAAQQYAYCPSSDPYRRLMKQAREAKRGLDACYNAAGVPGPDGSRTE